MTQLRSYLAWTALLVIILGGISGYLSVQENEYLRHGLQFTAFDEFAGSVNRLLYVLGFCAIAMAIILTALRLAGRNVVKVSLWLAGVAGLYFLSEAFELDYRLNLVWNELTSFEKFGAGLLLVIAADLLLGKKWLSFLSGKFGMAVTAFCAAVILVINLSGWIWYNNLQEDLAGQPNILIVIVDALRADHVTSLGYEKNTTPTIDSLAAEGVMFSQAVSNSNATRSTVPAIFTMMYPSVHGILGRDGKILSPQFVTLAELLKNRGYSTLAYMPNPPLKRIFNFDQGFDVYDDRIMGMSKVDRHDSAVIINERIFKWLDRNEGEKFFAYLHYIEPHSPYLPPEPYKDMFYDISNGTHEIRELTEKELSLMTTGISHGVELEINDLNYYIAQYDAEIRYMDDQLKYFFNQLKKRGLLENTMIFLTADHGEAFLEHGSWYHADAPLYDEVVHVPLVAKLPNSEHKSKVLDAPVHTFDISATILDYLDLEPDFPVQAKSMLPLMDGEAGEEWQYAFVESPNGKIIRNKEWKYFVQRPFKKRREMYNLLEDPEEKNNLISQLPEKEKELRGILQKIVELNQTLSAGHVVETTDLDQETIEQLKSLGYIK